MFSVSVKQLEVTYGSVRVLEKLDLDVRPGEFLVLLGPSGCGKSTLLNAIAGLLDIAGGQVWISGRNVTWAEPKDRGIGMVFQSYALYPRMTVYRNLSFGLRVAGLPRAEIEQRVRRAARMLHIEDLLDRRPAALSGGQRQRVAIGRALVRQVDVFLFDEPLSNLDAKLRAELRVELKRLHHELGNTMIYVTHDQIEALTLADRIAVMKDGIIQQLGDPQGIYRKPSNLFVAGFIGSPAMTMLDGVVEHENGAPCFKRGDLSLPLQGYEFTQASAQTRPALLGIRPEHVVTDEAARGAPLTLELPIEMVEPMGADTLVWTSLAGCALSVRVSGEHTARPGDRLMAGLHPHRLSLFDKQTGLRI